MEVPCDLKNLNYLHMKKDLHRVLPRIALVSGAMVLAVAAAAIYFRPSSNQESTANRKLAFDMMRKISIDNRQAVQSSSFPDYLDQILSSNVINTWWLISDKGVVIDAKGLMAASTPVNSNVYDLVKGQNLGLIKAVEDNMDPLQKELLYVAAAIRREGEHNDVIGHLVTPLKTPAGELAGYVGIAYDLEGPAHKGFYIGISAALAVCFLIYWLSLPLWVYLDARKRNEKYGLWTLFVLTGNLPAFIAYLLTRPVSHSEI